MTQMAIEIKDKTIEITIEDELIHILDFRFFHKRLKKLKAIEDIKLLNAAIDQRWKEASWNYSIWILSKRGLFAKELKEKLKKRYIPDAHIDATIEKAKQYGFIDDDRELEIKLKSQIARGKGKRKIVYELFFKSGIDQELIERKAI